MEAQSKDSILASMDVLPFGRAPMDATPSMPRDRMPSTLVDPMATAGLSGEPVECIPSGFRALQKLHNFY